MFNWVLALHWKKKMAGPVIGMCHSILSMVKDIGGITCDRMYVIFIFTWELSWDMKWEVDIGRSCDRYVSFDSFNG